MCLSYVTIIQVIISIISTFFCYFSHTHSSRSILQQQKFQWRMRSNMTIYFTLFLGTLVAGWLTCHLCFFFPVAYICQFLGQIQLGFSIMYVFTYYSFAAEQWHSLAKKTLLLLHEVCVSTLNEKKKFLSLVLNFYVLRCCLNWWGYNIFLVVKKLINHCRAFISNLNKSRNVKDTLACMLRHCTQDEVNFEWEHFTF